MLKLKELRAKTEKVYVKAIEERKANFNAYVIEAIYNHLKETGEKYSFVMKDITVDYPVFGERIAKDIPVFLVVDDNRIIRNSNELYFALHDQANVVLAEKTEYFGSVYPAGYNFGWMINRLLADLCRFIELYNDDIIEQMNIPVDSFDEYCVKHPIIKDDIRKSVIAENKRHRNDATYSVINYAYPEHRRHDAKKRHYNPNKEIVKSRKYKKLSSIKIHSYESWEENFQY